MKHSHHMNHKKAWYKRPLNITLICLPVILLVSFFVPLLHPFLASFTDFWRMMWWAILLGIFIAGLIEVLVPSEYVSRYLARPGPKSILYASILGFVTSACSHGVLAISMELYKKGASAPAVITFLLASPWANIAITIMLVAFFGVKAFAFIGAALVVALTSGFIYLYLEKREWIEKNPNSTSVTKDFSVLRDIKTRLKKFDWRWASIKQIGLLVIKGMWSVSHMVLWWIIIGTVIASAMHAFLPQHIFASYLGPDMLGLLITLAIATLIEICSEGSAPIAFSIYRNTGAFGNAFVFLMAGVITDVTEIGLIWTNIGKKAALWLPVVAVPQALAIAYLFNQIF